MLFIAICSSQIALTEQKQEIELKSDSWTFRIEPKSLQVLVKPKGKDWVQLSAGQENLGNVKSLKQNENELQWELPKAKLAISFRLEGKTFFVRFHSKESGKLTWPIISPEPTIQAYLLPLFEGSYVPSDERSWLNFLVEQSPMNTTEGLSMPFWGLLYKDYAFTYILTNPFNNELVFEDKEGRLAMRFTHEFTKNWEKKVYGFQIRLGAPSPVEPAKQYRKWLIEQGQFVTLQEKVKKVPDAEKLLGAAHVYLWGDAPISRHDIIDWERFTKKLKAKGEASKPSPGKRIWELMGSEGRKVVAEIITIQWPYAYIKNQVTNALSELLERRDFYEESAWQGVELAEEAQELLNCGISKLSQSELYRLNCLLLEAGFPGEFVASDRWGDGVSVKIMDELAESGFDRLWLGLQSWRSGLKHPQAIRKAKELGYLIAPYDSYHSIHHPNEADTWETAQFDLKLYETGPVVRTDGTKKRGFKGKGYILSPIAARPQVEKRVMQIMKTLPSTFNSWFIDCDAYGELFDDYSELHPATQKDDMNARLDRMAWIRDTYQLVIGSERGAAYAAPVIHFAHGMITPVIGWGDPDLQKNKKSKYYLGGYWPPDGPAVFVKQVPLKEKYSPIYYDSRFRLPLYQIVFHDSVIVTHQWGYGSLKFKDQVDTVELLELLYNVPPLYHLNLQEFKKHKNHIKMHYQYFSPLHRQLGLLPMTDFAWLTPERLVQRTVFGDRVEMVANFGNMDFQYQGKLIPKRSVLARWPDTGESRLFNPAQASR